MADDGDSGGSSSKRRRARSRSASKMATLLALTLALGAQHTAAVDSTEPCANSSTVVVGGSDSEAIVYDAVCTAHRISVALPARALNLSTWAVARVHSLPRVYSLDLSGNALETLQLGANMDVNQLDLRGNRILDLSVFAFPPRMTNLDLSRNQIPSLSARTPWPKPALLQTLVLDENPVAAIDGAALVPLRSLQSLSLVKTALKSLDNIEFPASLSLLNASSNALDSNASNFSNLPSALEYLDLSKNRLSKLPLRISELQSLIELNLASNAITRIEGVQLPKTLKKLNLDGNALIMVQICRADVATLARLELVVPKFELTACPTPGAVLEQINAIPVCVVPDCAAAVAAAAGPATGSSASTTPAAVTSAPSIATPDNASVLNNGSSARSDSEFSSKAIVVIGGTSFFIGLVVTALVFALYRKRRLDKHDGKDKATSQYLSFVMDQRDGEDKSDSNWVFDHLAHGPPPPPLHAHMSMFPNTVALLEETDDDKRRKPGLLDDLLVFEIPPEELKMRGALPLTVAIGTGGGGTTTTPYPAHALFLAEFQGFQVVLHARLRARKSKRRDERRFIEQIRIASSVDHPSIVQFIGLTFGTTSQQHGGTPRWSFAVVFEYMHRGSLASMFARERSRREGKLYYKQGGAGGADGGNLFRWFPLSPSPSMSMVAASPESDWRCKLSIALDIAMGLVYIHASQLVHGRLSARHVLVNDHGEAKLRALDFKLPGDGDADDSIRQSTRVKMRKMMTFKPSSFTQSTLGSSLLHGGGAHDVAMTPTAAALDVASPKFRETKGDIYAFGLLLWELDTMLSLESVRGSTASAATTAAAGDEQHSRLQFTDECPREIEQLARRCWSADLRQRPDALDLQEELVQLLEGRITTSSHAVSSWLRTTNQSLLSSFSSSKLSASSSSSNLPSSSVYAVTEFEANV